MTDTVGHREPDEQTVVEKGGYSKHTVEVGGVEQTCWMVKPPNGGPSFYIGMSIDGEPQHWVEEHEDGTITVQPNPPDAPPDRRNSNSILLPSSVGKKWYWHGWIRRGVWSES